MKIAGVSLVLILGFINYMLILFQLASGLKYIKFSPAMHKKAGIGLLVFASIHALLALFTHTH